MGKSLGLLNKELIKREIYGHISDYITFLEAYNEYMVRRRHHNLDKIDNKVFIESAIFSTIRIWELLDGEKSEHMCGCGESLIKEGGLCNLCSSLITASSKEVKEIAKLYVNELEELNKSLENETISEFIKEVTDINSVVKLSNRVNPLLYMNENYYKENISEVLNIKETEIENYPFDELLDKIDDNNIISNMSIIRFISFLYKTRKINGVIEFFNGSDESEKIRRTIKDLFDELSAFNQRLRNMRLNRHDVPMFSKVVKKSLTNSIRYLISSNRRFKLNTVRAKIIWHNTIIFDVVNSLLSLKKELKNTINMLDSFFSGDKENLDIESLHLRQIIGKKLTQEILEDMLYIIKILYDPKRDY